MDYVLSAEEDGKLKKMAGSLFLINHRLTTRPMEKKGHWSCFKFKNEVFN